MTSVEYLKLLLEGKKLDGHFSMHLIKQYCTIQLGRKYGQYSQDYRVLTDCQNRMMERHPIDAFQSMGYPYREAADCGLKVEFPEDSQPAHFGVLVESRNDLDKLHWPDPNEGPLMSDRINAMREFKRLRPDIVAMGTCEGAFAQANTFLGIEQTMMALYDDPGFLMDVMEWILPHEIAFCLAQIEAGAEIMFVGESLASQISDQFYVDYVFELEKRLVEAVQATSVPVRLHICGDINGIVEKVAETGARFIDLDYQVDLPRACELVSKVNPDAYVVGKFDPVSVLLRGTPDDVRRACRQDEQDAEGFDNFILTPGCEVPPATPPANYDALLEFGWKARAGVK